MRRAQRPFVATVPVGVAAARVHHEEAIVAYRFARRPDDRLVLRRAMPPERPPADLEGAESQFLRHEERRRHLLRLVHQQGGIRPDTLAIPPTQEPPDGLPRHLAEDVPQGDVDTADRVRDRAAAPEPEGVLMQFLAHPLWLKRILTL